MNQSVSAHLCIVTGQPLANLIPVLQFRPDLVFLVTSQKMAELGAVKSFEAVLETSGYRKDQVKQIEGNLPDYNLSAMREFASQALIEVMESDVSEGGITVNITGGNKLMALAFYQASELLDGAKVIYTDTEHSKFEILRPEKQPSLAFEPVLGIKTCLKAYGMTLRSNQTPEWESKAVSRRGLTYWLIKHVGDLQDFFSIMNGMVSNATKKTKNREVIIEVPEQSFTFHPKKNWQEALKKCSEFGVLQWSEERKEHIYFHDIEGARYMGGAWLEEYAWIVAREAGAGEVMANVTFTSDKNRKADIRNEIDLVICHNNRLLVMECKTARPGKDEEQDANMIYKLDSLSTHAAGVFVKAAFLSAIDIDHVTRQNRHVLPSERAKSMDIKTFAGVEIGSLKEWIEAWIKST